MQEWSREGGEDGKERAGVENGLVCRLICSFDILSEKLVLMSRGV